MLLAFLVVNEWFAILAIATRFMLSGPDNCKDVLCFLEDCIHFFERSVGGLGIEEVDDREDECIAAGSVSVGNGRVDVEDLHDSKNDVRFVLDRRE